MLQGKTTFVTGSISGIGLGIACSLATQGANIIMSGFDDMEALRTQITVVGKNTIRIGYHGAGMSKPVKIEAVFAYADAKFGGVDILVNSVDIQYVANVEDFPTERQDAIIAINLISAFHTTRLAVPGTKRKNWGRIINVTSVHGLVTSTQKSAYVAARHGIVGFTKLVALETAQTGIMFNAICPGWMLTPLMQKQTNAHVEKDGLSTLEVKTGLLMEKQPLREFVTPDQLNALAVFLYSGAAEQVCSVARNMDGGWVTR